MPGAGIGLFQVASRGQGGAAAFSPLSLFASSEEGAWYDPSDLSTLFQDAAGTVPVTADSQPVRLMLDKSGNANHATAPSDAARPLYRTAGGLHWLEFDGVDDALDSATVNLSAATEATLFAAARRSAAAGGTLFSINSNLNPSVWSYLPDSGNAVFGHRGNASVAVSIAAAIDTDYVITGLATQAPLTAIRLNTAQTDSAADPQVTTFSATSTFRIGRLSSSIYLNGRVFGLVFRAASSSAAEIDNAEAYMAAKSGVTLP